MMRKTPHHKNLS